ncbi:ABC transporter permease subunit [Streptomyces hainanensis]|uniref:ABC transporter permease n=1 Tax=Streptomyces hainanensis TaxID=402648 RepID=A0A4R4SY49_9ACTN|nr:ABC transporter permease subunit [Streptomyces hainanensis]TDC69268.1 ABC transporter permease [Streptomyces hainanensis]
MTAATLPVAEPRARFVDLLAAEWLKFWSLRSTPWFLLLAGLAVVGFNVGSAYDHYRNWQYYDAESQANFVANGLPLVDAFTSNAELILLLATSALGALAVTGEYGSGSIRTTFAAVPARGSVMAAKACVVAVVLTAFGAVVAGVSFWLSQALLSARDAGVSIDHPGAWRVVVASALLAPVSGLVGAAIGAVVRHSATAVIGGVVVLPLLPTFFSEGRYWSATIRHALPERAWRELTRTVDWGGTPYPMTTGGAWTVYAVWAAVAFVLTVVAVRHRDQ